MAEIITIILPLPRVIPYKKTAKTNSSIINKSHDGLLQFIFPKLAPKIPKDAIARPAKLEANSKTF